jgi:hypothetical protein
MASPITVEKLAEKVRATRNLQNKYFRIPKEDKEKRQKVLRASKACEAELDKLVSIVLDNNYDTAQ